MMQIIRFLLATLIDLGVIFISFDLIVDPKYGYGIFIIFVFLIPIRLIMIFTSPNMQINKKFILSSTSFSVFLLSLIWAQYNYSGLLMIIIGIVIVDFGVDLNLCLKSVKQIINKH